MHYCFRKFVDGGAGLYNIVAHGQIEFILKKVRHISFLLDSK